MKNTLLFTALFIIGLCVFSCNPGDPGHGAQGDAAASAMSKQDSIDRGAYLVTIMGCHDCHSPKKFDEKGHMTLDPDRLLSGHPANEALPKVADPSITAPGQWILLNNNLTAFVGPWGTSFAGNLTPDVTGTGEWTIDNLRRVFKEGKFKGLENGRAILPPMPWENLVNISEEDLSMIWIYLRSVKPVSNIVPAPLPPGWM